jgi:hypothetical protein
MFKSQRGGVQGEGFFKSQRAGAQGGGFCRRGFMILPPTLLQKQPAVVHYWKGLGFSHHSYG